MVPRLVGGRTSNPAEVEIPAGVWGRTLVAEAHD